MTETELREKGAAVANELRTAPEPLPHELRKAFIDVRAALFARGIYDPVLVRFDSATVSRASVHDIAEQLASVVTGL
jgi:hypothetical protein